MNKKLKHSTYDKNMQGNKFKNLTKMIPNINKIDIIIIVYIYNYRERTRNTIIQNMTIETKISINRLKMNDNIN